VDATALFRELHRGLPQQAPGSDASTARAFEQLGTRPRRVLDAGCGPGRQTLALARLCDAEILAVDLHAPLLGELRERVAGAGLSHRIRARLCSMLAPDLPDDFDLVWSEGAVYNVGFEAGLAGFVQRLAPGGAVALTELCWLEADPPEQARAFWRDGYPDMQPVDVCLARLRRAGFEPLAHFALPESDWWLGYYGPLEARHTELRARYAGDSPVLAWLDEQYREIELYRRHAASYGYVFYVGRLAR
jgi:SAM-dependent methyltransferase